MNTDDLTTPIAAVRRTWESYDPEHVPDDCTITRALDALPLDRVVSLIHRIAAEGGRGKLRGYSIDGNFAQLCRLFKQAEAA